MTSDERLAAAWAVVRALRTGEVSAARVAQRHLANNATFETSRAAFEGIDAVTERLTGHWTYTPVMAAGAWQVAANEDGAVLAEADFSGIGASPAEYTLEFAFDAHGRIERIVEKAVQTAPPSPAAALSPWLRRCLDRALAEGKPLAVSYVSEDGTPSLSLRGSIYTVDGQSLGLWLRQPSGGLADAIARGQMVSFLYRDSSTRTTLVGMAKGRIATDQGERDEVFDCIPEVEQRHDPGRVGAAAILDLIEMKGTSPKGPVLIRPPRI